MEERRADQSRGSESSSEAASTVKRWQSRWTPSEGYDSSGTSSGSEGGPRSGDCGVEVLRDRCRCSSSRLCLCQPCETRLSPGPATPLFQLNAQGCRLPGCAGSLLALQPSPGNPLFCTGHLGSIPSLCAGLACSSLNAEPRIRTEDRRGACPRRERSADGRRRRRLERRYELRAKPQAELCRGHDWLPHDCRPKTEERLRKLETERTALRMEVSVLSEQVDAQSAKIQELEALLREKKDAVARMGEALQKEVLSRSALETQKLELLSSLSEMKLRQASLEHENLALRTGSGSPVSNGERFVRQMGQYSSLPRAGSCSKKGVAFAEEEKTVIGEASPEPESRKPKPLAETSMEEIGDWLSRLGLECYAPELRRWGATGEKLIDASQSQLEKELDLKNPLHRKKLLYAIESEKTNGVGFLGSEKMDSAAVLRWLDDIGLPQHKEAFQNAKVDGRVLHRLTTEDLLNLGVTAQLHAASLRRGIQVLRELNFEFDNLERRSSSGNGADGSNVTLWTNHRVMEWLRVVDLAEYAPNMRGSGVHGGLMVYEARFTSELLATLLSISPGKTLLRRHLTTHFNQILGRELVQRKREIESSLGFVPLTLTARLKVPKKSQFTLKRKKSKNEADYGNLVCPLESASETEESNEKGVIGCL